MIEGFPINSSSFFSFSQILFLFIISIFFLLWIRRRKKINFIQKFAWILERCKMLRNLCECEIRLNKKIYSLLNSWSSLSFLTQPTNYDIIIEKSKMIPDSLVHRKKTKLISTYWWLCILYYLQVSMDKRVICIWISMNLKQNNTNKKNCIKICIRICIETRYCCCCLLLLVFTYRKMVDLFPIHVVDRIL